MHCSFRNITIRLLLLLTTLFPSLSFGEESTPEDVSSFLTNMPQNSDKRCVGIAGVAEALLGGEQVAGLKMTPAELSQNIYHNFTARKVIKYPAQLCVGGQLLPIDDKSVLESLSTLVANLYKSDYQRLARSQAGIKRLFAAQNNVVRNTDELVQLLNTEPDKTLVFCCVGKRLFPDGKVSDTSHAVLVQAMPLNEFLIYDPNDPETPIACQLKEMPEGLMLSWKCKYRDTNVTTTQRYFIVPLSHYFQVLRQPP